MSLAVAASASAQDHVAKATIPFDFNVGNTWLPAGTYTLTSATGNPDEIIIRNGDKNISVITMAQADDPHPGPGKLVFRKYGDQYFLHEVLCANCSMNVAFAKSKHEKLAQTHEASIPSTTNVQLASK